MRKTKSNKDLENFKKRYEFISGLDLPTDYLLKSDVYVFTIKNEVVAGFILGKTIPLRTIEFFSSDLHRLNLSNQFSEEKYCEVCCFWINPSIRKKRYINLKIWMLMAYAVKKQTKPFIVFGTNSKGLAKIYNYPKNSLLLHKDKVSNKSTFIFLARKADFFYGVWEIVLSRILKKKGKKEIRQKPKLRNEILSELNRDKTLKPNY